MLNMKTKIDFKNYQGNSTQTRMDPDCKQNDWKFPYAGSTPRSNDKKWLWIILIFLLLLALIGCYFYYRHYK